MRHHGIRFILIFIVVSLSACSGTPDRRAVYEGKKEERPLALPPDLALPRGSEGMNIPAIVRGQTSYSDYQGERTQGTHQLLPSARDARLVREGDLHWLEVRASAEELWLELRDFLRNMGFEIKYQDQRLGIMETNYLENRADVPTNWFSRLLNKLYSSGLMDKYRVRMERIDKTTTRVFITHRGLREVAVNEGGSDVVETTWQTRASDPELEAEMMQRFLVYRGLGEEEAKQAVASVKPLDRAVLKDQDNSYVLQVNENFPRTWRRVGLALDRLGLMVEDRNRSAGVYYIKLTEEFKKKDQKGFFASLFGKEDSKLQDDLLLKVDDQGQHTDVTVRDRQGSFAEARAAERILKELEQHLR